MANGDNISLAWGPITNPDALNQVRALLAPLVGTPVEYLRIPSEITSAIEPSQIGTIVGTITDLGLPSIALSRGIGLEKSIGLIGDREGYPDFLHPSGYRIELKGIFKDNPKVKLKKPPTPREPSARLTQKVTVKNVQQDRDVLLLLVYQLEPLKTAPNLLSPTITAAGVFPVIECVKARDARLLEAGGRWFGEYETPTIMSKLGRAISKEGKDLDLTVYGRKESEGRHFNEDTNFGKMKRIPYRPLQEFLRDSGCNFAASGCYPNPWAMPKKDRELALALDMAQE